MHLFASHRGTPGMLRLHAYFDLPTNPICWLFGHKAHVEIVEPRYSEPWRLVRCRVCDLRYTGDPHGKSLLDSELSRAAREEGPLTAARIRELQSDLGEQLAAGQVDFARRDPKAVARSCSGRDGYGHRILQLNAELHWRRPTLRLLGNRFSVRLHTGGRSSETPLDAHLDLGVVAGYFSVGGIGGRWCEFIGRGHGRDLSLAVHNGNLWWKLWYDGDGGNDAHHRCDAWRRPPWPWSLGRRKYRPWMCLRDGHLPLNPVTAIVGSQPTYHRDESAPEREAFVDVGQSPGDRYLVRFREEPWELRRDHGPRWACRVLQRGVTVDWDARPSGIPVRNHEWKGDETLAGSVSPPAGGWPAGEDWLPHAAAALVEDIRSDRARYQYRPPKPTLKSVPS